MSENSYTLKIAMKDVDQAKIFLDLYTNLLHDMEDNEIIDFFSSFNKDAEEFLTKEFSSEECKSFLIEGISKEKVPQSFEWGWDMCTLPSFNKETNSRNWIAEKAKGKICKTIYPNEGFSINATGEKLEAEFRYMHGFNAAISALFLGHLYVLCGFKVTGFEWSFEDDFDEEDDEYND